jgi:hypothetical protein
VTGGIGAKLTDKAIKAFITKVEPGKKLADGGGLYLFITPAKGTTWRIKYRIDGKEKTYSVGPYPLVSLAAARAELREVKALLLENKDPVSERRVSRAATAASADNTFQVVACEWLAMKHKEWSPGHFTKSARAFERDIYPAIGNLPIASITPAIVAKAVEDIHKRDMLETASRILQHLNGVFRYAQAKGLCRDNPAAPAREVLPRKKNSGRMPALLGWQSLGGILRSADQAHLSPSVRLAHRLVEWDHRRQGLCLPFPNRRQAHRPRIHRKSLPHNIGTGWQTCPPWLAQRLFHPGARPRFCPGGGRTCPRPLPRQ